MIRQGPRDGPEKPCHKLTFRYESRLDECIGDFVLSEMSRELPVPTARPSWHFPCAYRGKRTCNI